MLEETLTIESNALENLFETSNQTSLKNVNKTETIPLTSPLTASLTFNNINSNLSKNNDLVTVKPENKSQIIPQPDKFFERKRKATDDFQKDFHETSKAIREVTAAFISEKQSKTEKSDENTQKTEQKADTFITHFSSLYEAIPKSKKIKFQSEVLLLLQNYLAED